MHAPRSRDPGTPGLPPPLLATMRCSESPRAPCRLLRTALEWVLAGSFLEGAVKQPLPPAMLQQP